MFFNLGLLILATLIWGMGFVAAKWTLQVYTPLWSNALRFALAAIVSIPMLVYWQTFKKNKRYWKKGMIASLLLLAGVLFQIVGLKYTTVAKSGFLTSLYALFVPLILMITGKKSLSTVYWVLLGLCLLGIMLLCNLDFNAFNLGDFYTLLCALSFAFHILYLERIGRDIPSGMEFNALQSIVIGVLGFIIALLMEGIPNLAPVLDPRNLLMASPLAGIVFLGILSSVVAFGIQVHTQRLIPSHIVGPIFLLESPFAAIFGAIFLGERLNNMNIVGCFLIILSVGLIPLTEKLRS